jgi:hypothetical protein
MNGTSKPGFYYGSIKDGFTNIAPFGPKVSAKTRAQIKAKKKAIVAGKFHVFEGPIYDQAGKLKVKPGQQLKLLKDLYTMQWLVKGVVGKVSSSYRPVDGDLPPRIPKRRGRRPARRLPCCPMHGIPASRCARKRRELRGVGRRGAHAPR